MHGRDKPTGRCLFRHRERTWSHVLALPLSCASPLATDLDEMLNVCVVLAKVAIVVVVVQVVLVVASGRLVLRGLLVQLLDFLVHSECLLVAHVDLPSVGGLLAKGFIQGDFLFLS